MTSEEFQELVIEELRSLKSDVSGLKEGQNRIEEGQLRLEKRQGRLEERQLKLEEGQQRLEDRQGRLEDGLVRLEERQGRLEARQTKLEESQGRLEVRQTNFEEKLDAVIEQTAVLTEFRAEVNTKIDNLFEANKSIYEILGEHEVAIKTLKRKNRYRFFHTNQGKQGRQIK